MAITIPELASTDTLLDTDNIMLTHSNGNSEKIAGSNFVGAGTTCLFTANKTITGPKLKTGLDFKVMFTALITGSDASSALTLTYNETAIAVKVNKNGALSNFTAVYLDSQYKYLQANTILELIYNGTNFVIVGNPVVLKGTDYELFADGTLGGGMIGDIKPVPYVDVPYGWLECNGQAVSRTTYAALFNIFSTQKYDGTNTLLSRYGTGDGSTTFNLPDYREVALVGAGQNGTEGAALADHDVYTVGQFKDDSVEYHKHSGTFGIVPNAYIANGGDRAYFGQISETSQMSGRADSITRGKRKAVKYIIKVL